ncbi:MAG: flippase [Clostridia bacterium]|nr:flippase [Clostridia bacterium]
MSTRKNTAYNVAYRVFSVLLPLVTAPYLSRTVGREGVGLYSYAWNISYFFCLVAMLGLENYGTRAIAACRDDQKKLNQTFSAIWRMQSATAGLVLLVWTGYVLLVAGEEKPIAIPLTLMSVSCLFNLDWALMGLDQFRPIALRNTAVKLIAAACVFLFVKGQEDLWIYGLAWSAATVAGCLLSAASLRGKVQLVRVTWRDAGRHFWPCASLFVSVLAVSVYRIMDKVMVGGMAGMAQNGLYENAEKIIYCLSGFISAVGTVMLPKVTAMQKKGQTERIRRHLDATMQAVLCMTAAMAFGVCAVADRLCVLFYGEDFAQSAALMAPLGFTLMMIGFANVIRTQWILPQERDRVVVRSVCAGAVVNLAANLLLIPGMKAMGAVIGTLLAEFTVPLAQWLQLRGELDYRRYLGHTAVYAALGAAMLALVRLLAVPLPVTWPALILQMAAGALFYGAACLILWRATGSPLLRLLRFGRHGEGKK